MSTQLTHCLGVRVKIAKKQQHKDYIIVLDENKENGWNSVCEFCLMKKRCYTQSEMCEHRKQTLIEYINSKVQEDSIEDIIWVFECDKYIDQESDQPLYWIKQNAVEMQKENDEFIFRNRILAQGRLICFRK